ERLGVVQKKNVVLVKERDFASEIACHGARKSSRHRFGDCQWQALIFGHVQQQIACEQEWEHIGLPANAGDYSFEIFLCHPSIPLRRQCAISHPKKFRCWKMSIKSPGRIQKNEGL